MKAKINRQSSGTQYYKQVTRPVAVSIALQKSLLYKGLSSYAKSIIFFGSNYYSKSFSEMRFIAAGV